MSKEIDDFFNKMEKITERSGKLIIKIVTVVAAIVIGTILSINQLEEYTSKDDLKKDSIIIKEIEIDTIIIEDSIFIKPDFKSDTIKYNTISITPNKLDIDTIKKDTIKF